MDLTQFLPRKMTEGNHTLTVAHAEEATSENGNQMYRITLRSDAGGSFIQHYAKTQKALPIFAGFCATCGLADTELQDFKPVALMGKRLIGDVAENEQGFFTLKSFRQIMPKDEKDTSAKNPELEATLNNLF